MDAQPASCMQVACDPLIARATRIGPDLLISISGGDLPHIGSVVVAEPRPSRDDPQRISVTVSVINRLGHQDEVRAREAAERICIALNRPCVVTAGVHIDTIDTPGIDLIATANHALIDQLLQAMEDARWQKKI